MTANLAIPEPGPGLDVDDLESRVGSILAALELVDDLGAADEIKERALALERYLAKRADPGPAQTIARMAEVRLGELLDPDVGQGARTELSLASESSIPREDRKRFRLMARYRSVVEELIPSSRAAILKAIDRFRRRHIDADARAISRFDMDDSTGDGWAMLAGHFTDRAVDLEDHSVDLIVTDPPYARESLAAWTDLAEQAARLLKAQAILVALSGKIMLPEVIKALGQHLSYGWVYCQPLPGSSSRILARHVGQTWKPWLAFSNGPWPSGRIDWHPDGLDGQPLAKTRYHWEQSTGPALQLIHFLAPENGLVLDPFAGTGTYGHAALLAGRQFVGIEADGRRHQAASERLQQATVHEEPLI